MTTTLNISAEEATTYRVAGWALTELRARFEKLGKRAEKLGVPAPTITVVDTVEVAETVPAPSYLVDGAREATGRTQTFYDVVVTGEAPKYDGWSMAVVIDRDIEDAPNGPHVVHVLDVPETGAALSIMLNAWRFAADYCDYCADHGRTHPQGRKTLVVVDHDDGRRKVVGTTCLKDFLGHKAPAAIASWLEILSTLDDLVGGYADEDREDRDFGDRAEWRIIPDVYLAWVAASIRESGWVPRSAARYGGQATADAAITDFDNYRKNKVSRPDPPRDEDEALAAAALEWAQAIEVGFDTNDYLANVAAVAAKGGWRSRDLGIGASIIAAYKRATEQELQRKARAESLAGSEWVGAVKGRIDFAGTIIFDRDFDGAYGVTRLFKILTDDGNVLVWWASNGGPVVTVGVTADDRDIAVVGDASIFGKAVPGGRTSGQRSLTQGDRISGKATVKAHDEYDGVKQTVVTRAKVTLEAT